MLIKKQSDDEYEIPHSMYIYQDIEYQSYSNFKCPCKILWQLPHPFWEVPTFTSSNHNNPMPAFHVTTIFIIFHIWHVCLKLTYLFRLRPILFHPWESTPLVFIHTKAQGSWWLQLWLFGVPKETRIDQVCMRVHSYQCKRNILKNPCAYRNSTSHIFHVVFKLRHIVSYMCFIIRSPIFKSIPKKYA